MSILAQEGQWQFMVTGKYSLKNLFVFYLSVPLLMSWEKTCQKVKQRKQERCAEERLNSNQEQRMFSISGTAI